MFHNIQVQESGVMGDGYETFLQGGNIFAGQVNEKPDRRNPVAVYFSRFPQRKSLQLRAPFPGQRTDVVPRRRGTERL